MSGVPPPTIAREGGSTAWAIAPGALDVRFQGAAPALATDERLDRAWRELAAQFPQMFDGPMTIATRFAPGDSRVETASSSYRPYASAMHVERAGGAAPPHTLFAVTGFVTAIDASGERRLLLARRGCATWLYVGMWELAPAGGLAPPAPTDLRAGAWTHDAIARGLRTELEEETGIVLPGPAGELTPVAMVHDALVRSLDIVLRLDLGPRPEIGSQSAAHPAVHDAGEYSRLAWVPLAELSAFAAENEGNIIPPTLAVLRLLGLTGGV